jgi:hypothetical protein
VSVAGANQRTKEKKKRLFLDKSRDSASKLTRVYIYIDLVLFFYLVIPQFPFFFNFFFKKLFFFVIFFYILVFIFSNLKGHFYFTGKIYDYFCLFFLFSFLS